MVSLSTSDSWLICVASLVARQRALVARLDDAGDPRSLCIARQLLRSYERVLIFLLGCRHRANCRKAKIPYTPRPGPISRQQAARPCSAS
jgi:hypothetical protein